MTDTEFPKHTLSFAINTPEQKDARERAIITRADELAADTGVLRMIEALREVERSEGWKIVRRELQASLDKVGWRLADLATVPNDYYDLTNIRVQAFHWKESMDIPSSMIRYMMQPYVEQAAREIDAASHGKDKPKLSDLDL